MVMKCALLILFFFLPKSVLGQEEDNPLLNTKWKFKGYIYNKDSTLRECPENVNYTVEFKEDHKVSGVASLLKYHWTYKVKKNNRVLIKLFVPKGSVTGHPDQVEFEWRLNYGSDLGIGETAPYKIQGNQLKIFSGQYQTMLFELDK